MSDRAISKSATVHRHASIAPGSTHAVRPVSVDTRWRGTYGIGRYSTEVLQRLTVPWKPLKASGAPSAALSSFRKLPGHPRTHLVYSPGYNASVHTARQILTVHDLIHLDIPGARGYKYRAYYDGVLKPVIRRNRVVITVSETSRNALTAWLNDDRVEVINGGIGSSTAFSLAPVERRPNPGLLYVGNLRPHKNLDVALRAMAQVPDVELRVLVPAHEHARALRLAQEFGVVKRVTLLPRLTDEDLATEYRQAAATLMPSTLEGFGLPALESIQCGTPVLYFRGCTAVAETVGDRGTAVESSQDASAWAEAIADVTNSGRRVTPPPSDQFSWDRTAKAVSATLQRFA